MSRVTGGAGGGAGGVNPVLPYGGGDPETSPPRKPGRGLAVLKLVLGLGGLAYAWYLISEEIMRWLYRTEPKADYLIVSAVVLGLGVGFLLSGGLNLVGRRLGWGAGIVLALLVAGGAYFTVGQVYQSRRTTRELAAWNRLEASPKTLTDYKKYENESSFSRKGVRPAIATLELKEELVKMEGEKSGKVYKLREKIREFQDRMRWDEEPEYQKAIDVAKEGMARVYAKALEDLAERVEAESKGKREFPEDPAMRAAFAAALERVAKADDNRVYLAFSSENHLADVEAERTPDTARTAPGLAGLKQIDQGEAFSSAREGRRREVFADALEGALRDAFSEPLVDIEPLKEGEDRKGKVVLQVHCVSRRVPGYMVYTSNDKPVGTLFKIEVDWEFSAFDVDGKVLTKNRSRSNPASTMRFRSDDDDPAWAPYSVMMDSAYYNYCREVTGRLGMIPPAVKEYFVF